MLMVGGVLVGPVSRSFAQTSADECLVEFQDESGSIADNATLTQTASAKKCIFNLRLCVNEPQPGCAPASFQTKTFRASGHCGKVGQLQVTPSGNGVVCGQPTGITVRTKKNGKSEGRCKLRAEVRSARTRARKDVDRITLACEP